MRFCDIIGPPGGPRERERECECTRVFARAFCWLKRGRAGCASPRAAMAAAAASSAKAPAPCNGQGEEAGLARKWASNKAHWRATFPWLAVLWAGSKLTLTCRACQRGCRERVPRWRTIGAAQVSHFKEHAQTAKHKAALAEPGGRAPFEAPSPGAFAKLLRAFHSANGIGRDGLDGGVGKRQKLRKMLYCLAEAVRARTRTWLSAAQSLTTHSDASKSRLLVRGQMCGDDLEARYCLLGTEMLSGDSSALGIAESILRVLRDLATPLSSAPGSTTTPDVDMPALLHICSIVEVFNADAAADEQLAGTVLAGGRAPAAPGDGGRAPLLHIFPRLKVISKDKPHGARRITSRTWKCDPYLGRLADEVIMGKTSICQLVQHSDVLRARYAKHVRNLQHNPTWAARADSFWGAKHRFDTWQKPFSKLVLTFPAVLATAQEMHEERRTEAAGRHAKAFLNLLDEEAIISLAMMTDAGEENLELVRFLDDETMATTDISAECQRFLERISVLFEQRGCLSVGHTEYAISLLKKEHVVFIDNTPKRFGGKNLQNVLDRCFRRLNAWVKLAREVLAAEFPQFETVQAFSALRLSSRDDRRRTSADRERGLLTTQLTKLAQFFELDANALVEEFFDHLPSAQFRFDKSASSDSIAAWRGVVDGIDRRGRRLLKHHPAHTLRTILIRARAWGASTSGVEQLFARVRNKMHKLRSCMDEASIRDEAFLITTSGDTQAQVDELCQVAPQIWVELFGVARAGGAHQRRRRKGAAEPKPGSVKAFQKKRRRAVDALVEEAAAAGRLGDPGGGAPAASPAGGGPFVGDDAWTAGHEAEQTFQRKKRFKRALATMREGGLLPAEQAALFGSEEAAQLAATASSQLESKKISKYLRGQARKRLRRGSATTGQDVARGKRVYIDDKIVAVVSGSHALDAALENLGASAEPVREKAQCFVLPDLSSPGQRVLLNVGLSGGTLLSLTCLAAAGSGPFVTYERALAVRRKVWFSDEFKAAHPTLVNIFLVRLADVAAGPIRWQVIPERADFARLATTNKRGPTGLLAFVSKQEAKHAADLQRTTRLTAGESLFKFLAKVDRNKSSKVGA